jgi:ATP-dependent exoDNAse (exonuclease V) alpha subunit
LSIKIKNEDKISGSVDTIKEFAQGDHIMFLKNNKLIGVNNGQTGTINSIDENGINISKVEKDIADSIQSKDLSRMAKDGYAIKKMPQSSNAFDRGPEI